MAGTSGASTVVSEGNEGENYNSVDDTKEESSKRMKCEEKDDLISDLPDCLIQHIISLLPSTKDAIRTGILSKRWLYQWTRVPILIFNSSGMSTENFSNVIGDVLNLYNCSKINKFVINSNCSYLGWMRRKLSRWIHFVSARDVKELILECDEEDEYQLPQFLFKNEFLVKLKTRSCVFKPKKGKVNWASLKALYIGFANLPYLAIENVLSGSPVIEYLELRNCYGLKPLDIASKSLKTFSMFDSDCCALKISCPNLEKLELLGKLSVSYLKLEDLPPAVCVTFDFQTGQWHFSNDDYKLELVKEFLLQVKHVEELKLGSWFMMMLSLAAVRGESSLLLNNKCLTVIDPLSEVRPPERPISHLRFSLLEKLVTQLHAQQHFDLMESSMEIGKKFSELDGGMMSHLKIVEIVGLHYISGNGGHNNVLKFVEFLIKNAKMLEKIVLLEAPGQGLIFAHEVFKKLSCIQKASPHAILQVACLKWHDSNSNWDKIDC